MIEQVVADVPPGGPASDADLVRAVLGGETEPFELLMRRHNARVYRAVRSVLRDEDEAEDAMQQAYLQAFTHLAAFEGGSAFSTWLVRIAVNEALGRLRGRRRLVPLDEAPAERPEVEPAPTPEDGAATREAMVLLEKAIDRLPLHHRTVYVLREVDQRPAAEVAEILGVTEETAKVRLHRARAALRALLDETLGDAARDAFPFVAPRCDRVVAAVMARLPPHPR